VKRVLVVDDDRASCDLLREIFVSQDWQVETAVTPDEALQKAHANKFDLVVSDVNLEAEKSGLDLLLAVEDRIHFSMLLSPSVIGVEGLIDCPQDDM